MSNIENKSNISFIEFFTHTYSGLKIQNHNGNYLPVHSFHLTLAIKKIWQLVHKFIVCLITTFNKWFRAM